MTPPKILPKMFQRFVAEILPRRAHRKLTPAIAALLGIAGRSEAGGIPYPVTERTLDNGLRVYVVEMHSAEGIAAVGTWMSVGSRNEVEPGRTGFAHFFEHLMFHGSDAIPGPERERRLLRAGIEENAWTWLDETVYHALAPTGALPGLLELEADRFRGLSLTPVGVEKEAGAVYGEFRKRSADPHEILSEQLQRTAFRFHPYGHDTIGLEADIAAMPRAHEAAMAFFDRYYRPGNATLLVVGDVQPEAVLSLAAETLGRWETGSLPPLPIPPEPPQDGIRRTKVDWSSPASPLLAMGWRIGAYDQDDPDTARLELAARLLLSDTSPLQRRLVRETSLAYDVSGGPDETVDPGLFRITIEARSADELPQIEQIVREEIAALAAGIDEARLERLRTHVRQSFRASLDDPMTVLHVLGASLRRDPDPEALGRYQDALAAASAAEVSEAVGRLLVDRVLTVATLLPPAASSSQPPDAP